LTAENSCVTLTFMKAYVAGVLLLAVAVVIAGCRQADGPMPTPNESVQEDLSDVVRDLQNVAGENAQAPEELAEDLRKYAVRPAAVPAVDELTRRTAAALSGAMLTEQHAQRLAQTLWVTIAARELSERQVEVLQGDVQTMLTSIGVPEAGAQQVAAQVGEVQRAVSDRPRRWYELF
jgi:hypothetical protein